MKKNNDNEGARDFMILMIIVLLIFGIFSSWAQKPKHTSQVDSISIFVNGKIGQVGKVYKQENLDYELERVAKKYEKYRFNIVKYYSNGKVIQCKVQRRFNLKTVE